MNLDDCYKAPVGVEADLISQAKDFYPQPEKLPGLHKTGANGVKCSICDKFTRWRLDLSSVCSTECVTALVDRNKKQKQELCCPKCGKESDFQFRGKDGKHYMTSDGKYILPRLICIPCGLDHAEHWAIEQGKASKAARAAVAKAP